MLSAWYIEDSTCPRVDMNFIFVYYINTREKGAIYYVTITTVISSRVKITCYFHVWRYDFRLKAHLVFHWCLYNALVNWNLPHPTRTRDRQGVIGAYKHFWSEICLRGWKIWCVLLFYMSPPRGIREIWLRLKKTGTDVRREVDGLHVDVFAPSISADIGWESGKAFSGSGIWPKYGAGIGKTINILTGPGFDFSPGSGTRLNLGLGCGIFSPVCRVFGKCHDPNKRSSRQNRWFLLSNVTIECAWLIVI